LDGRDPLTWQNDAWINLANVSAVTWQASGIDHTCAFDEATGTVTLVLHSDDTAALYPGTTQLVFAITDSEDIVSYAGTLVISQ
jgi:hypothetical protein